MIFKIYTLGCKVNAYESEAVREKLLKQGLEEGENADIYIINTCAVTSEAERKDRQRVHEIARKHPESKIIVMGCSSQIHKEDYLNIPQVSYVLGNSKKSELLDCLKKRDLVDMDSRHFTYDDGLAIKKGEHIARAYLKVQDGCNNFCSYCVVPYTRGNSRSRKKADIIAEAKALLANGYKELVIGGIDTGSYFDPENKSYHLKHLLNDLANLPFDDYRLRVSSIEASQIDEEYISLFEKYSDRLCPHFHIPLQSGSPRILKLMNRKYSLENFAKKIELINAHLDNPALSTDVITGFPTETEEDFLQTYDFLKKHHFMRIHAFPYSERPFTKASTLKGSVSKNIRQERVRRLIELSQQNEAEYRRSLKNRTLKVLIEEKISDSTYRGYSENYLNITVESDKDIIDTFYKVSI